MTATTASGMLPAFNLALTLPRFDGSKEPYGFLSQAEVIKELHQLADKVAIPFVGMHLEKKANLWYETEIAEQLSSSAGLKWAQFKQLMERRFGMSLETARRKLIEKKQGETESAREYAEALRALVRHLGTHGELYKDSLLVLFTEGLRADVKGYVLTQRPESLDSAVKAAEYYERHIATGMGVETTAPFRSLEKSPPNNRRQLPKQDPKPLLDETEALRRELEKLRI